MADPIDVHVGRRVREARLYKGLTQTELGKALGVSFQQLQKYEQGTNRIAPGRLWRLSQALGHPVEWFFEGCEGKGNLKPLAASSIRMTSLIEQIADPDIRQRLNDLIRDYVRSIQKKQET